MWKVIIIIEMGTGCESLGLPNLQNSDFSD